MSTELATQTLQGVSDAAGALLRLRGLQEAVAAIMVKGIDYGIIPGTEKPTLYKPGAEKLVEFYGLIASVTVDEQQEDWERGFWHYRITCTLTNRRTGEVLANGVGSCNSMESRYRWRVEWGNAPRNQPPAGDGWQWVNTRKGGSWKRRTENEDRWDLPNTILKMAKKRAYVDATLSVTRSSGMFTQDLEDFAPAHEEEPAAVPAPAGKPAEPGVRHEASIGPERAQKLVAAVREAIVARGGNDGYADQWLAAQLRSAGLVAEAELSVTAGTLLLEAAKRVDVGAPADGRVGVR